MRRFPKRVVFAEGEEEQVIRAALSFVDQGLGTALLVGREERIKATAQAAGVDLDERRHRDPQCPRCRTQHAYAQFLYERLQRQGFLFRDCQRLINQDRNHFAAAMIANGDADAMVTGVTRNFSMALSEVQRVIDPGPATGVMGVSLVLARGRTVLVADTAITEMPDAEDLAAIAVEAAGVARRLGYEPRVALLAFSTFGHPPGERSQRVQEAVQILDGQHVDFEYDGEMAADVALNRERMAAYPFCRLSDTANVLIMPAFHSASISTHMLQELGGATLIGPLIVGLDRPVQIVPLGAKDATSSTWRRWRRSTSGGKQRNQRSLDMPFDLTPLDNAVRQLAAGLAMSREYPANEVIRDGVIQRFEYTYELSHKTLRRYLMATEPSPAVPEDLTFPALIRMGSVRGLLEGGWDAWREFRKARGTTSHAYDGVKAAEVFLVIPDFLREAEGLLAAMKRVPPRDG